MPTHSSLRSAIAPLYETARHLGNASSNYPTLYMATPQNKLRDMSNSQVDMANFERWRVNTTKEPFLEASIDKSPVFLTSFGNHLFVVDEKNILAIYTLNSSNNIQFDNTFKIPIPNVRSIAASHKHFGITYGDLDRKHMKERRLKAANGVVLFNRDMHIINFAGENVYELSQGEFQSPIGIAIGENFLFVCDKSLRSVYKFDTKTRQVLSSFRMESGEPYKLSINRNFLIVSDPASHFLHLYNVSDMGFVRNLHINQPEKRNGPFTNYITNDNIIFFKNYETSHLSFVDANLENVHVFSKITDLIDGFTILENGSQQTLVIGCRDKKKPSVFKLVCFSNL